MPSQRELLIEAYDRGYRVDDDGVLRCRDGGVRATDERRGYRRFSMHLEGSTPRTVFVHRLAGYQKYGERIFERGLHLRHKDNNGLNNRLGNILLGTPHENQMDIPEEERREHAMKAARAHRRLSLVEVAELKRDRLDGGMTYSQLREKYGVGKSVISYILHGRTYKDP